jgi:DNA-binding transcriptional LysR family regulator
MEIPKMRKPKLQKSTAPLAWDDLRTVLAVAREGSLSGAARVLQVEHSTVFRRIKGIERRFGAALFERARNGYTATAHGEVVAEAARSMEEAALTAERRVMGADVRLSGVVRIATTEMFASYLLPRVLPAFLEAHPDIEIEIGVSTSNVDLTRREADLALRASNQPPEHLYGREVGELRYAVFAHRRFFKGSKTPALEDLPLVGFDESLRHLDIARWLQTRLPGARARLRSDSVIAMMQAAVAGIGAAALPLFAADHHSDLRRLTEVLERPRVRLWVLNHAEMRENARVRALSRHLALELPATLALLQRLDGPAITAVRRRRSRDPDSSS